jgi:hypothetical protein
MKRKRPDQHRLIIALLTLTSFALAPALRSPAKITEPTQPSSRAHSRSASKATDAANKMRVSEAYGKLPMSFEPNRGQTDKRVKFLSRGSGYALFLASNEATLALYKNEAESDSTSRAHRPSLSSIVRMRLKGTKPRPKIEGLEQLQGKTNYLIGNDRTKWHTNIPTFAQVQYRGVYPGIDILYYGKQRQLEYDFRVAAGADPGKIRIAFDGADKLAIDAEGNLILKASGGDIIQPAPAIYQENHGSRESIAGRYVLRGDKEIGFEVAPYDRSKPLVIDPQLIYATFYGGTGADVGNGIAVDLNGNAYITGNTASVDLILKNPLQTFADTGNVSGSTNAFVTKLNAAGTDIVYSTYLGADRGASGNAIAVTGDGRAAITGSVGNFCNNSNFPTTSSKFQGNGFLGLACAALQGTRRFNDAFVTVLTSSGSDLFYSTFFAGDETFLHKGGGDEARGIAVDSANKVYITGLTSSTNLPTKNEFQSSLSSAAGGLDAFIAKFDPSQSGNSSLLYASYLGGTADDFGNGIAVDSVANAYVVGETFSTDLVAKASDSLGPIQTSNHGGEDAFVAKIDTNSSGSTSLVYSTYFGGAGTDRALAVAVDSSQRAYVTGSADSATNFITKNAFQPNIAGGRDAFVAKFNANGSSLFYSTFLGGSSIDEGRGIAIDSAGNAYVTGSAGGAFPVVNGLPSSFSSGNAFITKIEPENTGTTTPQKLYSDTFGGNGTVGNDIALDTQGHVYITGLAAANLQTTPGVFQGTNRGGSDAFVVKINSTFNDTTGVYRPTTSQWFLRNSNSAGPADISFTFGQSGDQPIAGDWNGDGKDDVGVFRPSTHQFLLRQPTIQLLQPCTFCPLIPTTVITTITINFGQSGDLAAVGDWNGDGIDSPGVFRPSTGQWLLTNGPNINNSSPAADLSFFFGIAGDVPLAGDWNNDGIDTVGVYRPSIANFFLSNAFSGTIDIAAQLGLFGDQPLVGDWDGDAIDTIGVFRTGTFFLRNSNTTGVGDITFAFGAAGDVPVAGDWDGKPADNPPNSGVNDPSEGSSRAGEIQLFTTTCSDPDGWTDIHTIDFKIAKSIGNGNGVPLILWLQFDQDRNVLRFYDPDTGIWSEGFIGAPNVLSSRFAELHLAGSSFQGSGPTGPSVQVTWKVVFKEAAIGNNYKQYLQITDDSGLSTGFDKIGSWSVTR